MKELLAVFGFYLKRNIKTAFILLVIFGMFTAVFALYALPVEAVAYAALLSLVLLLVIGMAGFLSFYKKHTILKKLRSSITVSDLKLPYAKDLLEQDYHELIRLIERNRTEIVNGKDNAYTEMLEYYTVWAHQIKTPIAAMRLLLQSEQPEQSEQSETNAELQDQLFRIEQYVEMVLQYLRMEDMNSDLLFRKYSLDEIIKQAVRKYSKSFIRKKIKLNYETLDYEVLTDEKWLLFVIEQLLSNSLKYTNEGEILLYLDKRLPDTLVIEDTGIGISGEDLPRVFEKGFTGYNGRKDKKSTGIGLYLCKQVLNKLSHTITIESTVGKGTKVRIGFAVKDTAIE